MNTAKKNTKKQNRLTIYHSHLDERLDYIKSLAFSMGDCVKETVSHSKELVLGRIPSEKLLPQIKKQEEKINNLQLRLFKACFRSLARQAPVAKDLRLVLAVMSANTDLERIGDLALNIAYRSRKMKTHSSLEKCYDLLEGMFDSAAEMVCLSLSSFVKEDMKSAKKVLKMDDEVDLCQKKITRSAERVIRQFPEFTPTCIRFIIVSGNVERIADHATNIAENIVFLQTGRDIRHGGRLKK